MARESGASLIRYGESEREAVREGEGGAEKPNVQIGEKSSKVTFSSTLAGKMAADCNRSVIFCFIFKDPSVSPRLPSFPTTDAFFCVDMSVCVCVW